MASSRTPSPAHSSNSENSATNIPPRRNAADIINAFHEMLEKKPVLIDPSEYMDRKEEIEKFKKYEADYTRRLKAKYFSDKDIFGGNIFDDKINIDGLTIKASRWPGTKSYADPPKFEDQSSESSNSAVENPTSTPNSAVENPTSTPNGKQSIKCEKST